MTRDEWSDFPIHADSLVGALSVLLSKNELSPAAISAALGHAFSAAWVFNVEETSGPQLLDLDSLGLDAVIIPKEEFDRKVTKENETAHLCYRPFGVNGFGFVTAQQENFILISGRASGGNAAWCESREDFFKRQLCLYQLSARNNYAVVANRGSSIISRFTPGVDSPDLEICRAALEGQQRNITDGKLSHSAHEQAIALLAEARGFAAAWLTDLAELIPEDSADFDSAISWVQAASEFDRASQLYSGITRDALRESQDYDRAERLAIAAGFLGGALRHEAAAHQFLREGLTAAPKSP